MITYQLTTTQWLALPADVKTRLKELFAIPRSAGTQVNDNVVTSDGYTHADLAHITIDKMLDYLGYLPPEEEGELSKEVDFFNIFHDVLDKIDGELHPVITEDVSKQFFDDTHHFTPEEVSSLKPFVDDTVKDYIPPTVVDGATIPTPTLTSQPDGGFTVTSVLPSKNKGGRPKGSKNKTKK